MELSNQEERKSLSLLASEKFGHNFHGEAKQPAAETPTEPQGPPETEQPPIAAEEVPIAAEETGIVADEAEEAGYELSDIAQLLGVEESALDVDDDGKIVINKKVDGNVSKAKVSDLLKIEQTWEAAEKRLEDAKNKAKTIQQEASQKLEQVNAQFAVAAKLIESVESAIDEDAKGVNWAKLREDDPAEYSAKQLDLSKRREKVEKMKKDALDQYQASVRENKEQFEAAAKQYLQAEQQKLMEKLPEWQDETVSRAEKGKISEYLMREGFTQEDIASASDHRLILIARKAMLYDQGQQKNEVAKKKILKVPKVMKPGTPKPAEQINRERLKEQKERLRKSGKMEDALALYRAQRAQSV